MWDMSRRDFLKTTAGSALALAGNRASANPGGGLPLSTFDYDAVKLTDTAR